MIVSKPSISNIIGRRLDPMFYNPKYWKIITSIKSISHQSLGSIAQFVTETWNQRDYFGDSFPYIEIGAIDTITGKIINVENVLKKEAPSRAKKIVRQNDIIISTTRPNRGAISYLTNIENFCIASTGFAVIRDVKINNISKEYLYIVLRLSYSLEQMIQRSSGGNYPAITEDELKKIVIPIPPIQQQKDIIDLYNTELNNKLQKDKEAKELLESIDNVVAQYLGIRIPKKSDFSETRYLTPISQLIGERYDPYFHSPYFERAFAELAKSKYPLKKLGDISVLITSGITPKAGGDAYTDAQSGIAFIRSGDIDINGNINFDELLYIKPEVHNKQMKSSKVYDNDIMIAIVGATIGQVGIYHSDKEANINQAIALVRLKDEYDPEYVKELIKSSIGQLNLDRLKRPVARANINLDEIASILIPIPEKIEIQTAIANEIRDIRVKAEAIKKEGNSILGNVKEKIEKMILG